MNAAQLAERFGSCFPERVTWRTIGREAEHPIVHPDGRCADIAVLWPLLAAEGGTLTYEGAVPVALSGPGYTYASEVGVGTMEIITDPCEDLHQLCEIYEAARGRLARACEAAGLVVLGYGIQPVTPPSLEIQTPKPRYGVLHQVLGPHWLWFTLTASDQVHVAVARDEVVPYTNLGNALSAATVALCGNSPVHGGVDSGVCSAREHQMGAILSESHRHGLAPPVANLEEHVQRMLDMQFLFEKVDGVPIAFDGTFQDWLDGHDSGQWTGFLLQDHYVWNSARPRSAHATLELRSACQQPAAEHMAATALQVGLVCAAEPLMQWLKERLGDEVYPTLSAYHSDAIRLGLAAPEPFTGFYDGLLDRCEEALSQRGRDEAVHLEWLRARVMAGKNPAQRVQRAFEVGGVEGLLLATAIAP